MPMVEMIILIKAPKRHERGSPGSQFVSANGENDYMLRKKARERLTRFSKFYTQKL